MPKVFTFLINTSFLIGSVLLAFFITSSKEFSVYSIQIVGLLVLLYFVNYFQRSKSKNYSRISKLIDSAIMTLVVMLVILTTGGLESPAIFLIFILITFVSLILNTLTALVLITLIGLLLPTDSYQLFIWLLIPPIISLISKQYLKLLEDQDEIKILKIEEKILQKEVSDIENDVSTFSQQALNDLAKNDLKKLQDNIRSLPDKIDEKAAK